MESASASLSDECASGRTDDFGVATAGRLARSVSIRRRVGERAAEIPAACASSCLSMKLLSSWFGRRFTAALALLLNYASFGDAEEWNRYIHETGLALDEPIRYRPVGDGPFAELIRGYIGDRGYEHDRHVSWRAERAQQQRPHVFVEKWVGGSMQKKPRPSQGGDRAGRTVPSIAPPPDPHLIGETEFAGLYAAADFAAQFELWLSTMVTLNWGLLGYADEEVQEGHLAFMKCLRDWLTRRRVPVAFIYSHENAATYGMHTHVAVHVPNRWTTLPEEFRHWIRSWARHRTGQWVPGAIRMRGGRRFDPDRPKKPDQSLWLHWLRFHYLVKSFDRSVIVQSARHVPDGLPVRLGELIAFRWRASGPVATRQRVGASRSLGPARRLIGVPEGLDDLLAKPVTMKQLEWNPRHLLWPVTWTSPEVLRKPVPPAPIRGPFRSAYENGARDVRWLYPSEFTRVVQRLDRLTRSLDD